MASANGNRRNREAGAEPGAARAVELVAAASHELRAALTAIIGCFEMLGSDRIGDLNAQQLEMVAMGRRNTSRLVDAVEQLEADVAELSSDNSKPS